MKWLKGYIFCCSESGNWERFMNLCRHHRIRLWNVKTKENRVDFCMYPGDYKKVRPFVRKTHVVPHIKRKKGFPFIVEKAVWDWTFTLGILLFFTVLKVLSLFVWQVNYSGQREYTKESINKQVEALGVYPGMRRADLNCDRLEKSLREKYENMSWVSAEEKGCVLNIKIKEGNGVESEKEQEQAPAHLIAPCDGVVQSIVTKEGTALVKNGAQVKKGDVLIQGFVEVMDDGGQVVQRHGVYADGEIVIETEKNYVNRINKQHPVKTKTGDEIKIHKIEWNNQSISIKNPLKWFDNSGNYDIISNICVDREFIPFKLNVRITEKRYIRYEKKNAVYKEKEAADVLRKQFESQVETEKEAGAQVVDTSFRVAKESNGFLAEGSIKMKIRQMAWKKIGSEELLVENEGKEDKNGTGRDNS